ncbi:MAG: hypothetical protein F4151_13755 [Gammaproteobacteria bacterium]|nr:hypothetical protein [Gammaproteobacteria bacterium]
MPDPYLVFEVQEEWLLDEPEEEMGSKKKFWYRREPDGVEWLFKFPRPDTGEHWAEKIAAEVAGLLGIPHARVELAQFGDDRGSVSESFTPRGYELVHGNQLLRWASSGYDPDKTFGQREHTLENVFGVVDRLFMTDEARIRRKRQIAEYLVLDALIGNTDRHHENWGVVRRRKEDQWRGGIAPSFDHASSLGRELRDERRRILLEESEVGRYVERGRGAVFWSGDERKGPSPLELVRRAILVYDDLFRPALDRLKDVDLSRMNRLIDRVPEGWMSLSGHEFAVAMVGYNVEQLRVL